MSDKHATMSLWCGALIRGTHITLKNPLDGAIFGSLGPYQTALEGPHQWAFLEAGDVVCRSEDIISPCLSAWHRLEELHELKLQALAQEMSMRDTGEFDALTEPYLGPMLKVVLADTGCDRSGMVLRHLEEIKGDAHMVTFTVDSNDLAAGPMFKVLEKGPARRSPTLRCVPFEQSERGLSTALRAMIFPQGLELLIIDNAHNARLNNRDTTPSRVRAAANYVYDFAERLKVKHVVMTFSLPPAARQSTYRVIKHMRKITQLIEVKNADQ